MGNNPRGGVMHSGAGSIGCAFSAPGVYVRSAALPVADLEPRWEFGSGGLLNWIILGGESVLKPPPPPPSPADSDYA
jgi:hypothetical protein